VTIVTCMKNEGPFILEWVAYHRSIGIGNFIVFSNDCADGTVELLDRLDELGLVTHLPNPAVAAGSTYFQPVALKFAEGHAADEAVGLRDVHRCRRVHRDPCRRRAFPRPARRRAGPFHALSMSELNFNSERAVGPYEDVWITEDLPGPRDTPEPGHWQARRGVKTIIHGIGNVEKLQAHRPFLHHGTVDDFIWLDGSARPLPRDFTYANPQNGIDRRGAYDLVCLNHYPLRSVESFLIKQDRGSTVTQKDRFTEHYFRVRSLGGNADGWIERALPAAREEWRRLMEDERLSEMHAGAVTWHKTRAREIAGEPHVRDLAAWIRDTYFKKD
jgi:hypothetical protein